MKSRKAELRKRNRGGVKEGEDPLSPPDSGKISGDSLRNPRRLFCKRPRERSALRVFLFSFIKFSGGGEVFFFFFFENTLVGNRAAALSGERDLQSSTPEEYLDGRVLADEAGLGDGPLAVEGDGGLPAQSGVDDRRDLLLLLQRLLLVSGKASWV